MPAHRESVLVRGSKPRGGAGRQSKTKKRIASGQTWRPPRSLITHRSASYFNPEKQGKSLLGELRGLRSIRAVGQRYRIIFRVRQEHVEVIVVALGLRREGDREDIYRLAQRLLRMGLLD